MNNGNLKIHYYQSEILRSLTLKPELRFNEIEVKGLESEHMNYHLKQLLLLKLVLKRDDGAYELTDSGKDYTNLLDDEVKIIEKQPKTSIIIRGVRKNTETGKIEHLMNKRLKQPYFGKVGRITGKVRFGETFEEAASRELFEETGLIAKSFTLEEIYRKLRKREDGTFVQDVVFYVFNVRNFEGKLIVKTDIQENFWSTAEELEKRDDTYDDLNVEDRLSPLELKMREEVALAEGF